MQKHLKRFVKYGLPALGAIAAVLAAAKGAHTLGRQAQQLDTATTSIQDYKKMLHDRIQESNARLGPEDPLIQKFRDGIRK